LCVLTLNMAQNRLKMGQHRVKVGSKMAQNGSKWVKMAQIVHKMNTQGAQNGSKWAQNDSKMVKIGLTRKVSEGRWRIKLWGGIIAQECAPRAQSWSLNGTRPAQIGPEKGPKGPFSAKFGALLSLYTCNSGSRWLKMAQNGVNTHQKGLKLHQHKSKWSK